MITSPLLMKAANRGPFCLMSQKIGQQCLALYRVITLDMHG
jgi:hypothetical protein